MLSLPCLQWCFHCCDGAVTSQVVFEYVTCFYWWDLQQQIAPERCRSCSSGWLQRIARRCHLDSIKRWQEVASAHISVDVLGFDQGGGRWDAASWKERRSSGFLELSAVLWMEQLFKTPHSESVRSPWWGVGETGVSPHLGCSGVVSSSVTFPVDVSGSSYRVYSARYNTQEAIFEQDAQSLLNLLHITWLNWDLWNAVCGKAQEKCI